MFLQKKNYTIETKLNCKPHKKKSINIIHKQTDIDINESIPNTTKRRSIHTYTFEFHTNRKSTKTTKPPTTSGITGLDKRRLRALSKGVRPRPAIRINSVRVRDASQCCVWLYRLSQTPVGKGGTPTPGEKGWDARADAIIA